MHYQATSEMDQSRGRPSRILIAGPVFKPGAQLAGLARHRLVQAQGPLAHAVRADRPDLLVMHGSRADPDLAALLGEAVFAELPVLIIAGLAEADAAGLLLGGNVHFLEAPADEATVLDAIEAMTGPAMLADAGSRFDSAARIEALKRDAERVASALAEMAAGRPVEAARPVDAARIRAHIKARRLRERFFAAELFADPAWDMLLDLSAARLEGRQVSVSSLCIAAAVPTTTGLRWIKQLADRGLLERRSDPADARRAFIALAPPTAAAMEACLDAVLNLPGQ
jgi:hypothetical protein